MALKNAPAKTPSASDMLMTEFKKDLTSVGPYLESMLPKGAVPRFVRMAQLAVLRDQGLLQCTKKSLLLALLWCAQKNLEPGVDDGCWIIPFKVKGVFTATPIPAYKGLIKRAVEVGAARAIDAYGIYENDDFYYAYGLEPELKHVPPKLGEDRGALIGAYSVIVLPNGEKKFKVMDRADIEKIRNAGAAWRTNPESGPWHDWEEPMFLKTVIKQGLKTVPGKEALTDLLVDDGRIEAGHGVAALLTEAGQEVPEDLQGEDELPEGATPPAKSGLQKSEAEALFDAQVEKELAELHPDDRALRLTHLAENLKISAKNSKKKIHEFKELAGKFFYAYTNKKNEQKRGYWAEFLDWEKVNYPPTIQAESGEQVESGEQAETTQPPQAETTQNDPFPNKTDAQVEPPPLVFADRKKALVMKILKPPIPLADLGLRALDEITADNIADIEKLVEAWTPPKKK